MTLIELMQMHRKIFSLIGNLHDLFCRGNQNDVQALSKVQDYNMTKILTRKCSIPDRSGDIKQARCDFDVLFNVQMDIEMYNYIDLLLYEYRSGKLKDDSKTVKQAGDEDEANQNQFLGKTLHAAVVVLVQGGEPAGWAYKRPNHDFMNNFFVNICARSFTDIEDFLKMQEENKDKNKQENALKELEKIKDQWKETMVNEA